MYGGQTIGVVVPAYNEEGFVGDVLDSLPAFVDRAYVIDDASTDNTWAEIRERAAVERPPRGGPAVARGNARPAAGNPQGENREDVADDATRADGDGTYIVAIRHEQNRGAGGAIKTGYLAAREDRVDVTVTIDADGQMDPEMMTRFIDPIAAGDAEYTKGDRLTNPEFRDNMPTFRLVGNWLLTGLTRIASGYWDLSDPQNGYTAISLAALEAVDIGSMYEYYGYCNDLLVKLNVAGMRVVDVPMPASYGDEESNIDYIDYIPKVSLMLLRNFFWRLATRYRSRPTGAAYAVGLLGVLATVVQAVRAVASKATGASDDEDSHGILISLLVAVVGLAAGVVFDRREEP
ncbi:glycosyltransferase family 2 protein [Halomicrococcus sp. NG-SE-24]|uniref:glycosyltransferase family 2 protein n=1 Tax=Halomicrococcus sp. NG-SE-24 TaxID=3436928 RepID=UPI003D97E7E7